MQIALDLKAAHGKAKFYELLATADAIIENYRPGVMQRLGLGWQNLHAKYPRLVMCSISGFGQSGPSSQRPAMDTVAQALSGLMSVTGLPDQPPHGHGANSADVITGVHAALGVVAALYSRLNDGKGRYVDIAMLDCNFSLLGHIVTRYADNREHAPRTGGHWYRVSPLGVFSTADEPIVLIAYQPKHFRKLCEVLGTTEWLQHPHFKGSNLRSLHFNEFRGALEAELCQRPRDEWLDIFWKAGLAASKVNTVHDTLHDEQLHHRKMLATTVGAQGREYTVLGNPVKISGFADTNFRHPVPRLDQHGSAKL